jgi:hypothetical protein
MRKYCKAYHLKDLHQFPAWSTSQPEGSDLTDESIVYLWDDFTVVTSPVLPDQGVLWQHVTPEWRAFCTDTLHFEIPEDLRYAYAQESQAANEQHTSSEEGA